MVRTVWWRSLFVLCLLVPAALQSPSSSAAMWSHHLGKTRTPSRLVIGIDQFPDNLNPEQTTLNISQQILAGTTMPLISIDRHGRLVPRLLTEIPTRRNHGIIAGGKEVILHLRPHYYWSSGAEITSGDIRLGWQVGMQQASGPACLGSCDAIASVTTRGSYEAVLHLRRPSGTLVPFGLPPLIPHTWRKLGRTPAQITYRLVQDTSFNFEDTSYWTDGPYQVNSFVTNDVVDLSLMRFFAARSKLPLSRITFRFYSDPKNLLDALLGGRVDIAGLDWFATDQVRAAVDYGLRTLFLPEYATNTLLFNVGSADFQGRPNPVHDVRVRRALSLALDRQAFARLATGAPAATARALGAYSPYLDMAGMHELRSGTSVTGAWDPLIRRYVPFGGVALRDARLLLQQAGYGSGLTIEVVAHALPMMLTEAQELAAEWGRIGVETTFVPLRTPWPSFPPNKPVSTGNYEVYLTQSAAGPDPATLAPQVRTEHLIDPDYGPLRFHNLAGISDPLIDTAFARAEHQTALSQRLKEYRRIEQRMVRQAYWAPLFYVPAVFVASPAVRGLQPAEEYDVHFGAAGFDFTRLRLVE